MKHNTPSIITRFAPSPTGFLHVGGVRTALYAWLFAKQNNGTLILRIEDTDKEREVAGSIDHIIESLHWLGITWNEGPDIGGPHAPYLQSQRLDSYKKYAHILIEKGLAYADPYTTEELEVFRKKSDEAKKPFLYREYRPENPPVWDGTKPLRLKSTPKTYEWKDVVRGTLTAGPEAIDDFILIKSDGYPTYNFAHIIDDLEMGVTHIFRADEFISSTPKFLSLYEALGIEHPIFVTLPPIMGPDGKKKLGKRDGAKDILDYKKEGIVPEAMMNFLALIGWNPGTEQEIFSTEELIKTFSISKIHVSGGGFNEEKLRWLNKEWIKRMPAEEVFRIISEKLGTTNPLIINLVKERIETFGDIDIIKSSGEFDFFFKAPSYDPTLLVWKNSDKEKTLIHLSEIQNAFSPLTEWTTESVKNSIWPYAETVGRGDVLWPLRLSLSGKEKSPDPFTIAAVLGKEETVARVNRAIELLSHV